MSTTTWYIGFPILFPPTMCEIHCHSIDQFHSELSVTEDITVSLIICGLSWDGEKIYNSYTIFNLFRESGSSNHQTDKPEYIKLWVHFLLLCGRKEGTVQLEILVSLSCSMTKPKLHFLCTTLTMTQGTFLSFSYTLGKENHSTSVKVSTKSIFCGQFSMYIRKSRLTYEISRAGILQIFGCLK